MRWIGKSSETVFENNWIELKRHDVITPKGDESTYGVVHFKNIAVGVIPVIGNDIVLVGQHRFPINLYSWEIPEGGCPFGEKPEDAARRELKEETGMECDELKLILTMHLSNSVTNEYAQVFVAEGARYAGAAEPCDTEVLQIKQIPLETAVMMVKTGEITDSMSVAGILALWLKKIEK